MPPLCKESERGRIMIDVIPNKTFLWSSKFPRFTGGEKYSLEDEMAKQMVALGYAEFAEKKVLKDPVITINGEVVDHKPADIDINIKSEKKALNPESENKALNPKAENKSSTKKKYKKRG